MRQVEIAQKIEFEHMPVLDGLRGIAVLLVIWHHLDLLLPGIRLYVPGGFLGVDVFFVLSGFLITSILLKEFDRHDRISLSNFYIRRTLRLVPGLWLFLVTLFVFGGSLLPEREAVTIYSYNNFVYAATYLMNWHRVAGAEAGNLNHTWSLAIEEQFYIIWSLILVIVLPRLTKRAVAIGTASIVALLIAQRAIRTAVGADADVLYYSTDTRIDALLIGCVASMAYCWRLLPPEWTGAILDRLCLATLIIGAASLFLFDHQSSGLFYGGISVFSISIAVLILWLVTRSGSGIHRVLELSPLRWLGNISYGLYLWHYVCFEFARMTFDSAFVQVLAAFSMSLGISAISFYFLEKPLLSLKSRFISVSHPRAASPGRSQEADPVLG
ncbi:MAG: acyltransferase [Pyrinomonadaceae bacterium]